MAVNCRPKRFRKIDPRFNEMESILTTLCHTVATLQSQMKKEDRPKSSEAEIREQRALMTAREQALVDQVHKKNLRHGGD
jgi:hypothetical protein